MKLQKDLRAQLNHNKYLIIANDIERHFIVTLFQGHITLLKTKLQNNKV